MGISRTRSYSVKGLTPCRGTSQPGTPVHHVSLSASRQHTIRRRAIVPCGITSSTTWISVPVAPYRGTSLIRKCPFPRTSAGAEASYAPTEVLGGVNFPMSEVPLYCDAPLDPPSGRCMYPLHNVHLAACAILRRFILTLTPPRRESWCLCHTEAISPHFYPSTT